ncbi:hypothetical protein AUC69_04045 [Methyloceanibacter superfactus]|uniref:Uncharacterized protein n=2 Tax=Methyloceanibacter superfactus TaxID=1774969 RepID=A0A1E3VJR0_9HYPH|nr:hypothetical protein AUC69_04045 [Methyloceanibacter superfactus]
MPRRFYEEDIEMRKFAIMAASVGVLAFTLVSLAPPSADAGWRRKAWRNGYGPGVSVYVAPRYGYYAPRRTYRYNRPYNYPYAYYPYWRNRYWGGWY